MHRLLHDRYVEYAPDRAWDLITGDAVEPTRPSDHPAADEAGGPLAEILEHGIDGSPRWLVSDVAPRNFRAHARAVAAEARRRGYVPIAVDVYLRLRSNIAAELKTRATVLVAGPSTKRDAACAALFDVAALSPRPHLLVSLRRDDPTHGATAVAPRRLLWRVHEARAVYGPRILRAVAPPREVTVLVERAAAAADLARAGRHAAAERLLRETAGALVRRQASTAAAEVYVQLGQLLLERGKATEADAAFGEAAAQAERVDMILLGVARIWQAAARTDLERLSAAESICRAVLLAGVLDARERARAEATLARVLMWQGRGAEAAALPFVRAATSGQIPFASATAVRVLIDQGDLFEAGIRARDLVDATAGADDPRAHVMALSAHLRLLLAAGDLTMAEARLADLAAAARTARTPLRLMRMRLAWAQALRRAGRPGDAQRELRALARMRAACPPLLRAAIDRSARDPPSPVTAPDRLRASMADDVAALVRLAQQEDEDGPALERVCERLRTSVEATRVELWIADGATPIAVVACGAGLPTRLAARALEAGFAIGPEAVESGLETAAPVRLGSKLVAAIAVRWPPDRTPPMDHARTLDLTCAVAAPRADSLLHSRRQLTQAATAIPELVGISAAMIDVRRAVTRAAAAPFAVLIDGESGVGKELVAQAIHQLSPRRDRHFCDVNCAALPDDLFEAELFGHVRGAFTGAMADRAGLVEEADGGTLFLDEVADLSARAQAKLLRVLQQQQVRRVGESFSRAVDVRIVCAANRDLRAEAEQGRFRCDLLYRLDVIRIRIAPLRERPEDIPALAAHFWAGAAARVGTRARLSHGVLAALARYHWPGNVRELQNVLAALAVEAPLHGAVRASLLPAAVTGTTAGISARLSEARLQWERRFVDMALARAGGSRSRAARDLGLSRQGLLKVLARLGLAGATPSSAVREGGPDAINNRT